MDPMEVIWICRRHGKEWEEIGKKTNDVIRSEPGNMEAD
jgi:hypothetical protein